MEVSSLAMLLLFGVKSGHPSGQDNRMMIYDFRAQQVVLDEGINVPVDDPTGVLFAWLGDPSSSTATSCAALSHAAASKPGTSSR